MKRKIKQILSKRSKKGSDDDLKEAINKLPRITNQTVAEQREAVLSGARKLIYPLQHSRHRIVVVSVSIFIALFLIFAVYSLLALYRFNTTSTFMYRVTQVVPFPVGMAGSRLVSYQDYLFELRHYIHYYETQQGIDFDTDAGQEQLNAFREVALQSVIDNAYVKQLAEQNNVSVSNQEVQQQVQLLRSQNRLGSSDEVFEDVLREFWGWSVSDFERELKRQLLAQKVVATLDTEAQERAQHVISRLEKGAKFSDLAKKHSDDETTRANGGDYGFTIERTNRDLSPNVVDAIFSLNKGETSGIIETPLGLEIVQIREKSDSGAKASHIFIAFKDINDYIDPLRADSPQRFFINP
jgi:hypothetical protein